MHGLSSNPRLYRIPEDTTIIVDESLTFFFNVLKYTYREVYMLAWVPVEARKGQESP